MPKEPVPHGTKLTSDGLQNVVAGLGTSRDKAKATGYGIAIQQNHQELTNMYRLSALAAKVIDIPADDMTREWRKFYVQEEDEDNQSTTTDTLEKEERRLGVKTKLNEALKWARLFGGSIVVIGMKDGAHAKPLDVANVKKGDLKYLLVVDRWQISTSGTLVSDPASAHFGCPEYYNITGMGLSSAVKVHYTRLLRFDGKKLPYHARQQNNYWGDSILQATMDAIKNKDTVSAAMVTMLFEANVDTVQVEGLADMLATKEGEAKVIKRWETGLLMKGLHRVLLLDGDETYTRSSYAFAGLGDLFNAFMLDVSAVSDIPATRLFGRSPAGMNATGESDTRNYYDSLSSNQETTLRPALEYLDEIFVRSTLGGIPADFSFDFVPLWQLSQTEQDVSEKAAADRDKIYLDAGVITEAIIAKSLKAKGTYPITQQDIDLLEELEEPFLPEEEQVEPVPPVLPPELNAPANEAEVAPDNGAL